MQSVLHCNLERSRELLGVVECHLAAAKAVSQEGGHFLKQIIDQETANAEQQLKRPRR